MDSGCTDYMIRDKDLFIDLDESHRATVGCGNASETEVLGRGRAQIVVKDNQNEDREITPNNALHSRVYTQPTVSKEADI